MQFISSVQNEQNQICIAKRRFGAFDSYFLHHIHGFANPGGIQQFKRDIVNGYVLFYNITRCAGNIGYNRFVITGKRIEQRGFAYIGAADDGRRDAFAQYFSFICCFEQLVNPLHNLTAFVFNKFGSHGFHIMLRVINIHFDMSQHFSKGMAQLMNFVG
ncbi:hypothetical protein D3C87_1652040 [compost metagenome]